VKTPTAGLQQQFTLSKAVYDDVTAAHQALAQIREVRERPGAAALAQQLTELEGRAGFGGRGGGGGGRGAAPAGPPTLNSVAASLTALMMTLQGADVTPTTQLAAAVAGQRAILAKLMQQWTALRGQIPAQ
jgi:hypothetical protein